MNAPLTTKAKAALAEPFISFSDVSKSYDGKDYVVFGLDLAIAKGEFVSLLGPSGSGKTTTLMIDRKSTRLNSSHT